MNSQRVHLTTLHEMNKRAASYQYDLNGNRVGKRDINVNHWVRSWVLTK
jgi:YD repeat-containing protein